MTSSYKIWADCMCLCVCLCACTDRLVFDGGAGHTEVQLAVLLDAGVNQSLHWALVLEEQEGVAYRVQAELFGLLGTRRTGKEPITVTDLHFLILRSQQEGISFGKQTRNKETVHTWS